MRQNEKPKRFSKQKVTRTIQIGEPSAFALPQIIGMCSRMRLRYNPSRYCGNGPFNSELDYTFDVITNEKLIVTIYGHENFDVRFEAVMLDLDDRPNVDERYVVRRASIGSLYGTYGISHIQLSSYAVNFGNRKLAENTGKIIKYEAKENPFRPQVRIGTTNAEFRKLLLRCKDKSFCLSAHNNEIGIFTHGEDKPVYSFKVNDTYATRYWAGADFETIFNSLYRRLSNDEGLIKRLSKQFDIDITEYGIIDNRIYVKVEQEGLAIYLMFNGLTPIDFADYQLTLPEKLRLRRGYKDERWQSVDEPISEETIVSEPTALTTMEWTTEEEARIQQWREAHVAYSIVRKKPSSESIQKWFSDYSMLLIRNGDSPDDLDFDIMSKV